MTDQEINIAVAEVLGVPLDVCMCGEEMGSHHMGGTEHSFVPMAVAPDYCRDLNAMHEAERLIPESERYGYCQWLMKLQAPHRSTGHMENTWLAVTATARQRAEAFLRTFGKWRDQ